MHVVGKNIHHSNKTSKSPIWLKDHNSGGFTLSLNQTLTWEQYLRPSPPFTSYLQKRKGTKSVKQCNVKHCNGWGLSKYNLKGKHGNMILQNQINTHDNVWEMYLEKEWSLGSNGRGLFHSQRKTGKCSFTESEKYTWQCLRNTSCKG